MLLAMLAHKVGQSLAGQRRITEGCEVPSARQRHARRALGHHRQDVLRVLHEPGVALGLRHAYGAVTGARISADTDEGRGEGGWAASLRVALSQFSVPRESRGRCRGPAAVERCHVVGAK